MSKHTPEPWEDVWLDDDNGWITDSGGNYLAEMVTMDEEGMCVSRDEAAENTRRIVAAVNACAGIPTEALEDGAIDALRDGCEATLDASLSWSGGDEERAPLLKKARTLAGYAWNITRGKP